VRGATAPRRHDSTIWTLDALDRLVSVANRKGNAPSKTTRGVTTTCGYDLLNRLTEISGATTPNYAYHGNGLHVGKKVGGTTTNHA